MSDDLVRIEPKDLDTISVVEDMVFVGQRTDTDAIGKFTNTAYKTHLGIGTINTSISTINTNIDTIEGDIVTIESTLSSQGSDISTLQSDVTENTSDIAALETLTGEHTTDIATNTSDILALDSLTEEIDSLVSDDFSLKIQPVYDTITEKWVDFGIVDYLNRIALSILKDGSFYTNGVEITTTNTDKTTSIIDGLGRILLELTKNGDIKLANNLTVGENGYAKISANEASYEELDSIVPYSVIDGLGRILLEIASTGNVSIGSIELGEVQAVGLSFVVTDKLGRIIASITNEGAVTIEGITADSGGEVVDTTPAWVTMLPNAMVESDYMSVPTYGQSLSIGAFSTPALSTTQPYNNKTLTGGVRTQNAGGSRASSYIDLIETVQSTNRGETPASGTVNYLTELLGGASYANAFVAYASGQGGQSLYNLSKANTAGYWHTRLKPDVTFAHEAAVALGDTHSVPFMTWTQGEANISAETVRRVYLADLLELHNDFADMVQAVTAQEFRPSLIMHQCCAHRVYLGADSEESYMDITLAQLDATNARNELFVSSPAYCLEVAADNLHLSNEGSRMLGYYYALAARRAIWEKNYNTCLKPKRVFRRSSTTVDVVYDLVHSPIRLNTAWVDSETNSGFDIRNSANTLRDIITGVSIVGDDTVRITTSSPVVAGDKVVYGWGRAGDARVLNKSTGPRGNVCDSQGDVYQYVGEDTVTRRLDNYAVVSENII